jgi:propionate CoA-transferase
MRVPGRLGAAGQTGERLNETNGTTKAYKSMQKAPQTHQPKEKGGPFAKPVVRRRYPQIISAETAARLVPNHSTITTGGFGSCGHPDLLTTALASRYAAEGAPSHLKLVFASGQGDKAERGIVRLASRGLLDTVIGGYWALTPALGEMALRGEIKAYNWPQGVVSRLFRAIASGEAGVITEVGLGTFIDPRIDGGRIGPATTENVISVVETGDREQLFYPAFPIHVAFLRGTRADTLGNIAMDEEACFHDSLAQAQAVHNSGGIVIVQVREIVEENSLPPHDVRIPGLFVDYLVKATEESHWQTYAERFNSAYCGKRRSDRAETATFPLSAKKIIARRAFLEITKSDYPVVNLGIGTPEFIARVAREEKNPEHILTIESGVIGGTPAGGLSFGASTNPQAILEQASQFDFYDGGGIDLAFLGFGQVDGGGNVNASRFGTRINGVGGFANISRNSKKLIFCGTFTAQNLRVNVFDGLLDITREGDVKKFVAILDQISFSAAHTHSRLTEITFITERAVFSLENGQLVLKEIAPGIDLERDIFANSTAEIVVPPSVAFMKKAIFLERPMMKTDGLLVSQN